ncbi:hypothetical protein BQ8482_380152 [Mesorhizobium delmotii]|uniref:Uncharacterized protein n=1 Tax=Mesorhizobium delmotii TaxID=1631247 RepID=A0A2P9AS32_9HYPH|nr:hypothetical protein BQ8482_380152 [Mesorhizobium delmotii]
MQRERGRSAVCSSRRRTGRELVAVLDVRSVSKCLGAISAVLDISFAVAAGAVVGLIGCQFLQRRIPAFFGFSDAGVAGLLPAGTGIRRRIEDGSADTGFGREQPLRTKQNS